MTVVMTVVTAVSLTS